MQVPDALPVYAVSGSGARPVGVRSGISDVHEALAGAGVGVYTAMRSTPAGGVLSLSAHLDRLADSCRSVGLCRPDEDAIRRALRAVLPGLGSAGCMARLDVRSVPAPHLDTDATTLLALWPLRSDAGADAERGVAVVTAPGARRVSPEVKSIAWMEERRRWLRDPDAAEHVLVDPVGRLLEGFTSSLLGVVDGELWTPAEGVLPGVTLAPLLEQARALGMPVRRRPIPQDGRLSELALTSSGRGIWPVVSVDGRRVGTGRPGPVVRRLVDAWSRAWSDWVERP